MSQYPDAFGMSVAVDDLAAAKRFYQELYPHDKVTEGVFEGLPYVGIMRNGETLVNIFQKGPGNPLADTLTILKVDSVAAFEQRITALGGRVLLASNVCPCTGTQFSICVDIAGNQFMIKEPSRV